MTSLILDCERQNIYRDIPCYIIKPYSQGENKIKNTQVKNKNTINSDNKTKKNRSSGKNDEWMEWIKQTVCFSHIIKWEKMVVLPNEWMS